MNKIKVGSQVKMNTGDNQDLTGIVTSYKVLNFSKKRLFHVKWGGISTNVLEEHLQLI